METKCELLDKCGFFKQYRETKDLACRGFIRMYCTGPKMNECKRKEYRKQYGVPPADNLMPNGTLMAA